MAQKDAPISKFSRTGVITESQKLFCEEYLLDWNGSRAFQTVFGTRNLRTARAQAYELLTRPYIQAYLRNRVKERNEELGLDQTYVIKKFLEIVETNFLKAIVFLNRKDFENLPENIGKLVQSVKIHRTVLETKFSRESRKRESVIQETYEVKFMSKDAALECLAKHIGAFARDEEAQNTKAVQGFAEAIKKLKID